MARGVKGSGAPRHKSRAARRDDACSSLRSLAGTFRDRANELREMDEDEKDNLEADEGAYEDGWEDAASELESLKEECESWKSGMEGTNLETSNKYTMLDEAVTALESACSTLDGISVSDSTDPDDLDSAADEMEQACDEAEGVEFPGMYS